MASYKPIQLSLADGSYEYYIHEKEGPDDPKGIGAFCSLVPKWNEPAARASDALSGAGVIRSGGW